MVDKIREKTRIKDAENSRRQIDEAGNIQNVP
jgi:hypothetical protein